VIKTDDGFGVYNPHSDGGFNSIGTGASRVTPAGSWLISPSSRVNPVPTSDPIEIDRGTVRPPVNRLPPWRIGPPKPPKPTDGGGTGGSDTSSLIDLFRSMFGTSASKPAEQSGAVVVYGDSAGGAPSGLPIGGILIGGALIGVGIWAYKKYA
jgi:hypothetical protein